MQAWLTSVLAVTLSLVGIITFLKVVVIIVYVIFSMAFVKVTLSVG